MIEKEPHLAEHIFVYNGEYVAKIYGIINNVLAKMEERGKDEK